MYRYEIEVWEKAEHWRFFDYVAADNFADAMRTARDLYPAGAYRIDHCARVA